MYKKLFISALLLLASLWTRAAEPFNIRGVYIDCRHEVMTVKALKQYADFLSERGINAILFEYEATFPFEKHAVLCNQYAYTKQEVSDFVGYCAGRGIDVIPLQNCFGHAEYILRHPRYRQLREDPKQRIDQVCPLEVEAATPIFKEIFEEVAALHPSKYFHLGADETRILGFCDKCAGKVAAEGKSKLFVDYVKAMAQLVIDMGKIPVIWGDIMTKHSEAIGELQPEVILIDWNYGWDVNKFGRVENLINCKNEVWGATAFRSGPDNQNLTQWEKHLGNLSTFIPFMRKNGYTSIINTSWSTSGEYGFRYDQAFHAVAEMYPIRSVYPQIGMNMLVEAFCEASASPDAPFDGKSFVERYASEHFGLTKEEDIQTVVDYYFMEQNQMFFREKDNRGLPVAELLDKCKDIQKRFNALKVSRSCRKEFRHLKLMLEMRRNYLEFTLINADFENASYTIDKAPELYARFKPVVKDAGKISRRFSRLMRGYLKPGQAKWLNYDRTARMMEVYKSIKRQAEL